MTLLAVPPAAAQAVPASPRPPATGGGDIRGRVVDAATKAPIASASVNVTTLAAPASVGRASTGADGGFRVGPLKPGRYRVRIFTIGYTPRDLPPVDIKASAPQVDVGTVTLTAAPLELQSLVVTGQKPDVLLAPDRTTYVVRDMPTTRGGNVLDVLRNVPSVDVDIDNVVSLRGNSGVVVQINGRPSPMKPAQLGNFLAQLPANMVDKVEVVPNPSAREDPDGVAGIINIVLKRTADAGTSGGLTIGGGTTGHADIGGTLGYQRGPLSLYGSYGFLRDNRPRTDAISRENRYLDPVTYLEESGFRSQIPVAHTFTGTGGYRLGTHDELSADLMYSTRNEAEFYNIQYRYLDAARDLSNLSDRQSQGINHEFNFESTLGYKHAFTAKAHKLSGELRLVRAEEGGPYSIAARTLALDGAPVGAPARETQTGWEHPGDNSLKVDYVRPLTSHLRLETGYKGSLRNIHTTLETEVFDSARARYLPDSARINDFTYHQQVHAAYAMLGAKPGKWLLQAGLRAELATTQFHLKASGATYDNPYNSLFPSALVAYDFDDAHQIKLSYSTRIRRPDDADVLDPTPHYLDPLNLSRGNPYLKPEYIRALELGFKRTAERLTVQVTPFYRHTLNAVRTLRTIDSTGVTTRTFANVATTDAYGADATVSLSGRLSGFAGASAFRQISNAANLAPGLSARTYGWTARTNVSFHVSSALDLQTLLFYQSPLTVEQGRIASRTRLSLAARQKLMNDRLGLTLRLVDPFNTSRETSTTIDPQFYQVSDRRRAIRGLLLSASWTFGRGSKEHDREPNDPDGGNGS